MDNIEIIKLDPSRWREYKELRLEALKDSPQAFLVTYNDELAQPDEKWQNRIKEEGIKLFAKDNTKLIGMVGAYTERFGSIRHVAKIWGTYVNPDYRSKGVGQRLMEEVISEIKKMPQVSKINIEVVETQIGAWGLYKKLGFKEVGRYTNQIKTGKKYYDEILLEMLI